MEDNSYIKYTRSLHTNQKFKSLSFEYRHIFLTILVNMAFKPIQLNDHGHLVDLKAGQLMITYRQLVKLCDEESIDLPKIQRALKMFENIGFSIQETIHRKTIITIIEPSICESIKSKHDTRNDTKSIQDRYKIDTQKKKEKKEEKEKKEHTPPYPQTQEIPMEAKRVSEDSFSFKSSNEKPSQTLKTPYGKEQLVYLTTSEYDRMCSEETMTPSDREYWINQIEIAMMREGVNEFNRKNKSHYHTIIAWRLYREGKGGFNPVRKAAVTLQENKVYAEDAENNYHSEHYQIHLLHNRIEFGPKGCYGESREIRFDENGFKDQLKNYLDKYGFKKLKYERA